MHPSQNVVFESRLVCYYNFTVFPSQHYIVARCFQVSP